MLNTIYVDGKINVAAKSIVLAYEIKSYKLLSLDEVFKGRVFTETRLLSSVYSRGYSELTSDAERF